MREDIAVLLSVYKNDTVQNLSQSINSLINQVDVEIHLYIGVDGRVDRGLIKCIEEYEKNSIVSVLWFKENRGLAAVLNDLLSICFDKGYCYFARMDADDISRSNRLKLQLSFLKTHPDVDVVGGAISEIDENGKCREKTIIYPYTSEACRAFFARRNPHAHPAVLFRKSFFDKAGCLYRPEYRQNQDTMLWYDGMMKGTCHANIPEVVLDFRMSDSLFKKRRNGLEFAKKQLKDRLMINRGLSYGLSANVFAICMFLLLISPVWIKKYAYKYFR